MHYASVRVTLEWLMIYERCLAIVRYEELRSIRDNKVITVIDTSLGSLEPVGGSGMINGAEAGQCQIWQI